MSKSPEAFRTISEVAELLETPAHVLRFWESRFPQIRPVKRAGGRRYYRPTDVALLTGIKRLLHDEGMTIRGVQKILREQGVKHVSGMTDDAEDEADDAALEAALAQTGDAAGRPETPPPAEAETAQIFALQTALRQSDEPQPTAPPSPIGPRTAEPVDYDLFARLAEPTDPEAQEPADDTPAPIPSDTAAPDAEIPHSLHRAGGDPSSDATADSGPVPDADEAPMEVWAEPDPIESPPLLLPDSAVDSAPDATLRSEINRIGAATPQPAPAQPHDYIARRLRATPAASLSTAERATVTILRAKARSLRDRLASNPRHGA